MDFPADYFVARDLFCERAARRGFDLQSHRVTAEGPHGEELTIDVAASPMSSADSTLIVTSGLHGVEGFFGSAVQCRALERWNELSAAAPKVRWVFVHALNPFGFAHLRRCDENNVDLNRNFLIDGESYSGAPRHYADLDWLLNPQRPPRRWEPFRLQALAAILRFGMPAIKQAVAGGQYEFPHGLFYGGKQPSATLNYVRDNLDHWIGPARRALHLDLHTGLGRFGELTLLVDDPVAANCASERSESEGAASERSSIVNSLKKTFGEESIQLSDPRGIAYRARGALGTFCADWRRRRFPHTSYRYLCAEFGAYSPLIMAAGLRAENQAHHWGQAKHPTTVRAKQRLKELFCPSTLKWRRSVAQNSSWLLEKAAAYLQQNAE